MKNTLRTRAVVTATTAIAALTLAACSPGSSIDTGGNGSSGGSSTVTFRLWDEAAADAYKESFDAFTEANPDVKVKTEIVPWANYWEALPRDLGAGTMADIFWTNTSNFALYADNGNLIDIDEAELVDQGKFVPSSVDLYTRNGALWGVPQLTDSIALFYNADLLAQAGIDPATLKWDPSGTGDTFLPAVQELTVDAQGKNATESGFNPKKIEQYGFNSQNNLQAIYVNFLGENGARYQNGDQYAFNSPEGVETFQYLVDLINKHHVSPSAAETNQNGDLPRDLFVQGKMALFQSGQYSLPHLKNAEFEWGIAPMVEGPQGRVGVIHSVAAVGNADSENLEATKKVLSWLGTAEGQEPLGAGGAAFPAVIDAQGSFTQYWDEQGVDTSQFLESAEGKTIPAPLGPKANAGANALAPFFEEMFAGRLPVEEALKKAQDAANEAIAN